MGSFGGFYKGDKKKPKKNENKNAFTGTGVNSPVLTMPEIISKRKKDF